MYQKTKKYLSLFLVLTMILSFAIAVVPNTGTVVNAVAKTSSSVPTKAQIDQKVQAIYDKYGITVLYQNIPQKSGVEFSVKHSATQVYKQLSEMDSVLSLYPANFAKTVKLKKIYLVKDLKSGNYSADGLSIASLFGPKLRESNMYLNVPSGNGTAYTLHHELMHVMEYAMPSDRKAWLKIVGSDDDDVYWENASGDLSGYANRVGFVTNYAGYSVMEDRAETYAVMMMSTSGNISDKALTRLGNDSVIKNKFDFILAYCKEKFPNEKNFLVRLQEGYNAVYTKK